MCTEPSLSLLGNERGVFAFDRTLQWAFVNVDDLKIDYQTMMVALFFAGFTMADRRGASVALDHLVFWEHRVLCLDKGRRDPVLRKVGGILKDTGIDIDTYFLKIEGRDRPDFWGYPFEAAERRAIAVAEAFIVKESLDQRTVMEALGCVAIVLAALRGEQAWVDFWGFAREQVAIRSAKLDAIMAYVDSLAT